MVLFLGSILRLPCTCSTPAVFSGDFRPVLTVDENENGQKVPSIFLGFRFRGAQKTAPHVNQNQLYNHHDMITPKNPVAFSKCHCSSAGDNGIKSQRICCASSKRYRRQQQTLPPTAAKVTAGITDQTSATAAADRPNNDYKLGSLLWTTVRLLIPSDVSFTSINNRVLPSPLSTGAPTAFVLVALIRPFLSFYQNENVTCFFAFGAFFCLPSLSDLPKPKHKNHQSGAIVQKSATTHLHVLSKGLFCAISWPSHF